MNNSYQGNINLKRKNIEEEYTSEQISEILKCRISPVYFIENYIHIINLDDGLIKFKMYDYQKKFIMLLHKDKRIISMQPRQSGKTVSFSAYMCHYIIFNSNKVAAILGNKDKTAREILYRIKIMFENLPIWLKPGVVEWNKTSVEFDNGSRIVTAATSSSSIRGMSINFLCVPNYTKVCVMMDNGEIYHTSIERSRKLDVINSIESKLTKGEQVDTMNIKHKKEFYTVYKITNIINQKEYIGFHSTNDLEDGYMGSGKIIKRAIEKYKPENFIKEYIEIFDNKDDAEQLEAKLVDEKYVKREETCKILSDNNTGSKHTEESLQKISAAGIKNWKDPTFREKMNKRTPRSFTEEQKIKHSEILTGREFTDEHCENISKGRKKYFENMTDEEYKIWYEKTITEEFCENISKRMKGFKKPWQDKINKNPDKIKKTAEANRGSKRTEQTKEKMSLMRKGKPSPHKGKRRCYDPITLEKKYCLESEIPENWVLGNIPK